jgi:chaperonin GroES
VISNQELYDELAGTYKRKSLPVQPVGGRLIIEYDSPKQFYGGGLIAIPEKYQDLPKEATVLAVGSGRFNKKGNRIPLGVKEGDRVKIGPYIGIEFRWDEKSYYFISEDHIVGIIN